MTAYDCGLRTMSHGTIQSLQLGINWRDFVVNYEGQWIAEKHEFVSTEADINNLNVENVESL